MPAIVDLYRTALTTYTYASKPVSPAHTEPLQLLCRKIHYTPERKP